MSKSYIVHKNIPIPAPQNPMRKKGHSKYKWMLDLDLNDHIVAENRKEADRLHNAMLRLTVKERGFIQRGMSDGRIGMWVSQIRKRSAA